MATLKRFGEMEKWKLAEEQCNAFYALAETGNFKTPASLKNKWTSFPVL